MQMFHSGTMAVHSCVYRQVGCGKCSGSWKPAQSAEEVFPQVPATAETPHCDFEEQVHFLWLLNGV